MATGRVGIRPYSGGTSTTTTTTAVSFDTDAQAFITATALTDTTQKNAINDLVLDLKAAGVWTKMKALYPMVGGTATTHKFNLKDPRDLDAAYRLSFAGGGTHGPNGYQLNGTTAYADTFLAANTMVQNSTHFSFYSRTNRAGSGNVIMGYQTGTQVSLIYPRFTDNNAYANVNRDASIGGLVTAVTNTTGLYVANRTSSTNTILYKNNIISSTNSSTSIAPPSISYYLGTARNLSLYDNLQCAFSSIGDGLTDLESNLFYQIVEKYQYALGRNVNANQTFYFNRNYSNETNAFIFNGAISDATQQSAINTLVNDLKAAGIWTKMKAVYPMVGGTATAHKFNLVNPIDSTSAYALTFNGGWTHTSTGATPNGTTGYANTNLIPASVLSTNSTHISYYSRTDNDTGIDMGVNSNNSNGRIYTFIRLGNTFGGRNNNTTSGEKSIANTNGLGHYINNRIDSANMKLVKNGNTTTLALTSNGLDPVQITIGAMYNISSYYFGSKQCAFSSIGDGLTDLESNLFYQIVEKFQYTLGRNINTSQPFYYNSAYSNETNAFIFNGAVTDATQISAVNTLVTTLKTAGIWTKMKALYPMVGGTALAHKFNLVNPIDAESAYALTFNGGWTHTSNGATPNGTTGYANTNLVPNTVDLGFNFNMNISFYSRTNRPSLVGPISDMGCLDVQGSYKSALIQFMNAYDLQTDGTNLILSTDTNTLGMIMASRTANNSLKAYRNGGLVGNNTATISNGLPAINYYLGAFLYRNASGGFANYYGTKECAFASIGNGLTDAEATTFYNAVQAFQTTLGRQV